MISRRLTLWALAYGLLIWLEATLIIRWAGDLVFIPENKLWTVGGFVITALIAYAIGWFFFATFQTPPAARAAAASLICAWIEDVFPTMTAAQERLFAGWLVWGYGIGLLSGLWPARLPRVPVK
jgi:hypothetical protein